MRLIKDYMREDALRHELNELSQATFYINFEDWVTNGFYEGDYIPYSFEEEGRIIANVSANIMNFLQNGEKKKYIQLGTVMTAPEYRKQGLAAKLMRHVMETYEGKCDGIYLFANLSALDFYRKLGFEETFQYQYILKDTVRMDLQKRNSGKAYREGFVRIDSSDIEMKDKYKETVRKSVANGGFEQENKFGLQMFYTHDLENVYYSKNLQCFAVMEQCGDSLELQSVISTRELSIEDIVAEISLEYKELKLGFTPRQKDCNLFDAKIYDGEDDYRLFCMGSSLESIEKDKLYFPALSHA